MPHKSSSQIRLKVELGGVVQGVGFRPFIYTLAQKNSLFGWVCNDERGLSIEIEGSEQNISQFMQTLESSPPPLAQIQRLQATQIPIHKTQTFEILPSKTLQRHTNIKDVMPLADSALCAECKEELQDKTNRRYAYPFINCTNCGPRFTIMEAFPYDREKTSMKKFSMCKKCKAEYEDPLSRRFHAQILSCFDCGPKFESLSVRQSADLIREGSIVAIQGAGGFHFVCDATNESALEELRRLKQRPAKPFGVMFKNLAALKELCFVSRDEERVLLSKERPIVLLKRKKEAKIARDIAPHSDMIGAFLPSLGVHELLFETLKTPLVFTSANRSAEPIIKDPQELREKFADFKERTLSHNVEIVHRCDDSVVMHVEGEHIMLRLSRAYGPKSFYNATQKEMKVLALGANQKSTITLAFAKQMILSTHIGELDSLETFELYKKTIEQYKKLYDFEPDYIVCDLHPEYQSSAFAKEYLKEHSHTKLLQVQHHHAHALACMAEYGLEEEVLAFCFDGMGYADAQSEYKLWGAEVLKVTPKRYTRSYHLQTFSLFGAQKALKEPRRIALALLFESFTLEELDSLHHPLLNSFTKEEFQTFATMYKKNLNSPKTSSMGRLFDAAFALCGNLWSISYEGESGGILESLASTYPSEASYSFRVENGVIEYKEMIKEMLQEKEPVFIAAKFFNTVVDMMLTIAKKESHLSVVLCGGVFQNRLLMEKCLQAFKANAITYYVQNQTPLGDGGISLGQAYYALHRDEACENE